MKLHKLLPLLVILGLVFAVLWLTNYAQIDWLEDARRTKAFMLFSENYWAVGNTDAVSCWTVPVHKLLLLKGLIIALVVTLFSYVMLLLRKKSVYWSLLLFIVTIGCYWLYEKLQFCQHWMDFI